MIDLVLDLIVFSSFSNSWEFFSVMIFPSITSLYHFITSCHVTSLEEATSRLTVALEELRENRREEEQFNNIGAKWKHVAKILDRLSL